MGDRILAILAHQSAQVTVDEFLPQWRKVDCHLRCYVPVGDTVTGFDDVQQIGVSAHSGYGVFRRFIDTCRDLLRDEYEHYIIAEYDTLNMTPELPMLRADKLTTYVVWAPPHNTNDGALQLCLLSPWCFPRHLLARFVEEAERQIEIDPDAPRFGGLLDRWIGWVVRKAGIPTTLDPDLLGYPYFDEVYDLIKWAKPTWVHGWKRKEDFKDVWPQ